MPLLLQGFIPLDAHVAPMMQNAQVSWQRYAVNGKCGTKSQSRINLKEENYSVCQYLTHKTVQWTNLDSEAVGFILCNRCLVGEIVPFTYLTWLLKCPLKNYCILWRPLLYYLTCWYCHWPQVTLRIFVIYRIFFSSNFWCSHNTFYKLQIIFKRLQRINIY